MKLRANRVGEQMKKELGDIISRKIKDPTCWICYSNRCTSEWGFTNCYSIYFCFR